jgi:iron complex transport system substrate-binding protein
VSRRIVVTFAALAGLCVLLAPGAPASSYPHRIVSLSPTATEDLFAIGAGKQVVAVDDHSDYPKRAPRTKLSGFQPNAEAVIGYHPDLVVIEYDPNGLAKALAKAHIRVVVQHSAHSLGDAYAQIGKLGALTGHVPKARALVSHMTTRIALTLRATKRVVGGRRLSVYQEFSPDFYSASSWSYVGRIYRLFGLRNIADAADSGHSGFPQLSAEAIIGANPDLIVLSDIRCCGQTKASVAARPGWGGIKAVRRGSIALIDDSIASRWGPRTVTFVQDVARVLRKAVR